MELSKLMWIQQIPFVIFCSRFYFPNKVKQILHYLAWRPNYSKVRQLSLRDAVAKKTIENNGFFATDAAQSKNSTFNVFVLYSL